MKVYRHHTKEFQERIQNANSFIEDTSRSFNLNHKNKAQLYFYAETIKGAESYKQYDDDYCSNVISELFIYEVNDSKLLDLRTKEGRIEIMSFCKHLLSNDLDDRKDTIKRTTPSILKKMHKKVIQEMNYKPNLEDVLNNANNTKWSGTSWWGKI